MSSERRGRPPPRGWLAEKFLAFHLAHERLKHTVHTAWRMPLPPWGRAVMGFVYFSLPVIGGYQVALWAISKSEETVEERLGSDGATTSSQTIQGLGDKKIVQGEDGSTQVEKVGAGGWGGGVHLVTSDKETQDINRINLERFLRRQRKAMRRREGQQED